MTISAPIAHALPEPLIEFVARRFRVLGEPMRIKLLDHLRDGAATVGELQDALGATQQNVSKHLGILHGAGIVSRTKHGNHTRYEISDPQVFDLCEQVCGASAAGRRARNDPARSTVAAGGWVRYSRRPRLLALCLPHHAGGPPAHVAVRVTVGVVHVAL